MENILENRVCDTCGENFCIYQKDKEMLEHLSPIISGKKYILPFAVSCPQCRRQKRLSWRNTFKLYRRKCDATGKDILAFYDETVSHPVYDIDFWNTDKWDPLDYGMDFDFSRSFFEQFGELKEKVPHFSRSMSDFENSDFCNNASNLKNCYLCFNGGDSESTYYSIYFKSVKNCIDCYSIDLSENCYECIDCINCNKLFYSQDSLNCNNSYFLKNCNNCKFCFFSKNLLNESYCIFNKKYTKEEYEKELNKLFSEKTYQELSFLANEFYKKLPEKSIHGINIENTIGDYINNSKNIFECYDLIDCENLRYCTNIKDTSKDLMDVDLFGWGLEKCFNSIVLGHHSSNIYFSFDCWLNVSYLYYCSSCIRNVTNCFGCVGLHDGKQYCILNKQYTKEQYEILVTKIIEHMIKLGEWGEFFPSFLSSYGYNQTEGMVVNPMTKKEALSKGYNWSDYESPFPKVEKIIPADKLPYDIKSIPDDILNWAIECEVTKKPFRIIYQELEFYRKHKLSIPRRHPDQRHIDRIALRNPRKLFNRNCDKCGIEINTTYSPEKSDIVYCEKCYNLKVY